MNTDDRHLAGKSFADPGRVNSDWFCAAGCFRDGKDDPVLYEGRVDLLGDRLGVSDIGKEESVFGQITWVSGAELVLHELICLLGSEVDIICRVICEVRESIGDQAVEGKLFAWSSHI